MNFYGARNALYLEMSCIFNNFFFALCILYLNETWIFQNINVVSYKIFYLAFYLDLYLHSVLSLLCPIAVKFLTTFLLCYFILQKVDTFLWILYLLARPSQVDFFHNSRENWPMMVTSPTVACSSPSCSSSLYGLSFHWADPLWLLSLLSNSKLSYLVSSTTPFSHLILSCW